MKYRLRKKLMKRMGCKTYWHYRAKWHMLHDAFTKARDEINKLLFPMEDEQNFSIMFNYDYEKEEYVPVVKCINGFTMKCDE